MRAAKPARANLARPPARHLGPGFGQFALCEEQVGLDQFAVFRFGDRQFPFEFGHPAFSFVNPIDQFVLNLLHPLAEFVGLAGGGVVDVHQVAALPQQPADESALQPTQQMRADMATLGFRQG